MVPLFEPISIDLGQWATGLLIFFSITTASATTFGGDLLLNFHFTLDFGETCFQNFFQKFVRILVPLSASRCYTNMDTSLHIENALGQALCPLVLKAPRRLPKRSFSVQAGVHVGATSWRTFFSRIKSEKCIFFLQKSDTVSSKASWPNRYIDQKIWTEN